MKDKLALVPWTNYKRALDKAQKAGKNITLAQFLGNGAAFTDGNPKRKSDIPMLYGDVPTEKEETVRFLGEDNVPKFRVDRAIELLNKYTIRDWKTDDGFKYEDFKEMSPYTFEQLMEGVKERAEQMQQDERDGIIRDKRAFLPFLKRKNKEMNKSSEPINPSPPRGQGISSEDPERAGEALISGETLRRLKNFDLHNPETRDLETVKGILRNFWRSHLEAVNEENQLGMNTKPEQVHGSSVITNKGKSGYKLGDEKVEDSPMPEGTPVFSLHSHPYREDREDFRPTSSDMDFARQFSIEKEFLTDPSGRFMQYSPYDWIISDKQLVPELSKLTPFTRAKQRKAGRLE